MKIDKITIKNYKCFEDNGCSIENIKPINIIIGKNNSGKSSLIETVKFLTDGNSSFFSNRRNGKIPEIVCEHKFSKDLIGSSFPRSTSGGQIKMNHYAYGEGFDGAVLNYRIEEGNRKRFVSINRQFAAEANNYFNSYTANLNLPLAGKIFKHLSAERDIQPEKLLSSIDLSVNGNGATNLIQQIINRDIYESDWVEKLLLKELNIVLNPDINFTRILVQQDAGQIWEIYFENDDDGRIALSKMGSGIKTVLLVLILLHILPKIENRAIDNYVFALEELENNLHPSLQRRLYYYLYEFTTKNKCIIFLTTHSSIVIDLFNSLSDSQIFHINKVNGITSAFTTMQQSDFKTILEDLDVRASDILQSNCIIWVEGPSDRAFLNKWISLCDADLVEGFHYSIMFYGGRMLSNVSFDYDMIDKELIPLLRLNRNSFVLIDRDGKEINTNLNATKKRIQDELGEKNVWITKGREIENYLNSRIIEEWLQEKFGIKATFKYDIDKKLEVSLSETSGAEHIKYNLSKNGHSKEIVKYISEGDLNELDLEERIHTIVKSIKYWNRK